MFLRFAYSPTCPTSIFPFDQVCQWNQLPVLRLEYHSSLFLSSLLISLCISYIHLNVEEYSRLAYAAYATTFVHNKNKNLPDPTCTNEPNLRKIVSDSSFPSPLSPFGQSPVPFPWLEIPSGTLHLVLDPLLHPNPSLARWLGHIVMEHKRSVLVNLAARHKMRSTSSSGPVNL